MNDHNKILKVKLQDRRLSLFILGDFFKRYTKIATKAVYYVVLDSLSTISWNRFAIPEVARQLQRTVSRLKEQPGVEYVSKTLSVNLTVPDIKQLKTKRAELCPDVIISASFFQDTEKIDVLICGVLDRVFQWCIVLPDAENTSKDPRDHPYLNYKSQVLGNLKSWYKVNEDKIIIDTSKDWSAAEPRECQINLFATKDLTYLSRNNKGKIIARSLSFKNKLEYNELTKTRSFIIKLKVPSIIKNSLEHYDFRLTATISGQFLNSKNPFSEEIICFGRLRDRQQVSPLLYWFVSKAKRLYGDNYLEQLEPHKVSIPASIRLEESLIRASEIVERKEAERLAEVQEKYPVELEEESRIAEEDWQRMYIYSPYYQELERQRLEQQQKDDAWLEQEGKRYKEEQERLAEEESKRLEEELKRMKEKAKQEEEEKAKRAEEEFNRWDNQQEGLNPFNTVIDKDWEKPDEKDYEEEPAQQEEKVEEESQQEEKLEEKEYSDWEGFEDSDDNIPEEPGESKEEEVSISSISDDEPKEEQQPGESQEEEVSLSSISDDEPKEEQQVEEPKEEPQVEEQQPEQQRDFFQAFWHWIYMLYWWWLHMIGSSENQTQIVRAEEEVQRRQAEQVLTNIYRNLNRQNIEDLKQLVITIPNLPPAFQQLVSRIEVPASNSEGRVVEVEEEEEEEKPKEKVRVANWFKNKLKLLQQKYGGEQNIPKEDRKRLEAQKDAREKPWWSVLKSPQFHKPSLFKKSCDIYRRLKLAQN